MSTIEIRESVPVIASYDVIVAGGGVAGVAAAVAAKRMGKSVLLIEKTICLGGLATIGLVNLFVPMCNGRGTQIIKGMADELLALSIKYGFDTVPEEWKNGDPGEGAKSRLISRFSVPMFTLALTELIKNEEIDILFDTIISKPIMDGNMCKGLVVENKSGREFYGAKMVIDATGDADVLFRAGVPTVQGRNFHTFYMYGATMQSCQNVLDFEDMSKLAVRYHGGRATLLGLHHPEGKPYWLGTNGCDVTNYVVENHLEALEKLKGDDRKTREVFQIPTMAQFRTTRRIDGDYTLKTDDVYKHFDDSVTAVNDFENRDFLYEVPYGTMVKTGFPNLITVGRCAAGEGYAWDILRVIPPAIVTGQAAGIACSIALDDDAPIHGIDVGKLQGILEEQNVMIHFDDALIPENSSLENAEKGEDIGHI